MESLSKFMLAGVVMVCLPVILFAVRQRGLPLSEFADTEVSRDYPLVQTGRIVNGLDFTLSFKGTSSNNVEVAFGSDADSDGALSWHETDFVIGWKCGRYFIENFKTGEMIVESEVGTNGMRRILSWHYRVSDRRRVLKSFAASNEVGVAFADFSADPPDWIYGRDWNLMKMTARGVDVVDESFDVEVTGNGFVIELR